MSNETNLVGSALRISGNQRASAQQTITKQKMLTQFQRLSALSRRIQTHVLTIAECNHAFAASMVKPKTDLTIDAFDTLITRTLWAPSDAFLIVGRIMCGDSLIDLSPEEWAVERISAEEECRHRSYPFEVTLDEIYSKLASKGIFARRMRNNELTAIELHELTEIELLVEKTVSRVIGPTSQFVADFLKSGSSVTVLSDTYLPSGFVRKLLEAGPINSPHLGLITSSEARTTKYSGALFQDFRNKNETSTDRFAHIGDNRFSDVLRARQSGFMPIPYLEGRPNRFELILNQHKSGAQLASSIFAGSARAARLAYGAGEKGKEIWKVSSCVTGPLLYTFVSWLLSEAVRRKFTRLYFLSRDGEILMKIAAEIVQREKIELDLRYLYVSRASLHIPAIVGSLSLEDIRSLRVYEGDVFDSLLAKLGLSWDQAKPLLESRGLDLRPNTKLTKDHLLLLSCVDSPLDVAIRTEAARQRSVLLQYLKENKFFDACPAAVVDIGWNGRLQRSLCKVAQTIYPDFEKRLCGFYFGLQSRPEAEEVGELIAFTDRPDAIELKKETRETMFEMFCAAGHGTVTGYKVGANGIVPELRTPGNPEAQAWGLEVQQAAILEFSRNVTETLSLARMSALEAFPDFMLPTTRVVQAFLRQPSRSEAVVFGDFMHSASSLHSEFVPIAAQIKLGVADLLRRLRVRNGEPLISYWPEASVRRSFPSYVVALVMGALRAGQLLRRR